MAAITVTNTFTNGTAADATEVNQNFTDLVNGLGDGTKDITVSAITAGGAVACNGAVTMGNATGDDITITGRIAADVDPKTASTHDLGDATQLWNGVYAEDFLASIGAVGSPGHSFHADTNTGMYSAGADTLNFATGGVLGMTISSVQVVTLANALPVASGGTGQTSSTGSGAVVLAGGPTLTGTLGCATVTATGDLNIAGNVHFNTGQGNNDVRMDGDAVSYTFFLDASTDRIGIAKSGSLAHVLDVVGTAGLSTGTAWTDTSDERLKVIHGDFEYGLKEIRQLNPIRFNYDKNSHAPDLGLPCDIARVGFGAAAVRKVIPEAVDFLKSETHKEHEYMTLNVDPIHWATVNAVKELADIMDSQALMIERLTAKIEKLGKS